MAVDVSLCVCGHSRRAHRDTQMSVPLEAVAAIYPLPVTAIPTIVRTHPGATYDSHECFCGCNAFEADERAAG